MKTQVSEETPKRRSVLRSMLSGIPTLLVLGALTAVGLWGHRTGWTAPRFDGVFGREEQEAAEDWCAEHNVPDSRCIACHPELAGESAADWCKEHGVPESRCTVCHPEILQTGVAGDWCREHGVPESGCTICHAEIARKGEVPADDVSVVADESAADVQGNVTKTAGVRDPSTCQTHASRVQFASPAAVAKAGLRLGKVIERPMTQSMAVIGQVEYDATRFARVSSRVSGVASKVEKEIGAIVKKGDVLAIIESAEVGRAKAEYLQSVAALAVAHTSSDRINSSTDAGYRTEAERQEAQALVRQAEIRLYSARLAIVNLGLPTPDDGATEEQVARLGIPDSLASTLPEGAAAANMVPLLAPLDGVVVLRDVVASENVEPERVLFAVADVSRMWITMDVPAADVFRVALGQGILFQPDDARDHSVRGTIDWLSTAVSEATRTVAVRAVVDNADGSLRAHSFGRSQIVLRGSPNAIAVPNDAIQWEGCCHVVFVRLADDVFQTRKVRLGGKDAAYTEVLVGVLPGEVVVTTGSHVLRSEILKSNLGAGCCAD